MTNQSVTVLQQLIQERWGSASGQKVTRYVGKFWDREREFEQKFGFSRGGDEAWNLTISDPKQTVCLQAVDYFLWGTQRFYERKEDRYLNMLWPQIGEIHDLDFGPERGTFYRKDLPLVLDERFGKGKKKKS